MESAKQQIILLVSEHQTFKTVSKRFNREIVNDFKRFIQLLKRTNVSLTHKEEEMLEMFLNKRIENLNKYKHVKYFEEVYEMLWIISTELTLEETNYHFLDLVAFYWNALKEKYKKIGIDLVDKFQAESYENLVKDMWPYVIVDKIEMELRQGNRNVRELLLKITEYLHKPNLLKEDCYKIVENCVGNKNFTFLNYEFEFFEERPGYLGDYYKVLITFIYNNQKQTRQFFAKALPLTGLAASAITIFKKEDFFYFEFIPKLKQMGFHDIDDFIPKCYFSRKDNIMVMEDVSLQGYISLNGRSYPDLHLTLVITKALAKLHACTFMFEETMSTKLGRRYSLEEDYYDFIQEACVSYTKVSGVWMTCAARHVHEFLLDQFPNIPKKLSMRIFKRRAEYLIRKAFIDIHKSSNYKNAISHADLWANNCFYKLDDTGKPESCILIDFQLTRYAPPALDLIFFIYLNLSKETRKLHTKEIVDEYYNELHRIFQKYNLDINQVYTKQTFWDSFNYYKATGICQALFYAQLPILPEDVLQKVRADDEKLIYYMWVHRSEELGEALKYDKYKARIEGLVEDLYECCENLTLP